jgi:hypothetical protein
MCYPDIAVGHRNYYKGKGVMPVVDSTVVTHVGR